MMAGSEGMAICLKPGTAPPVFSEPFDQPKSLLLPPVHRRNRLFWSLVLKLNGMANPFEYTSRSAIVVPKAHLKCKRGEEKQRILFVEITVSYIPMISSIFTRKRWGFSRLGNTIPIHMKIFPMTENV
jgi:hypothetical protein